MWIDDLYEFASEGSFVAVDVEGDGNNPQTPVEIAAVEFDRGIVSSSRCWLVNPGRPMSAFVQVLHGITNAMLADKPPFAAIEDEFRAVIEGRVLVAHKAADDLRMLRTVMPDVDFVPGAVLDTQKMARNLVPQNGSFRLEAVKKVLSIDVPTPSDGRRWGEHAAETDATVAGHVFLKLAALVTGNTKARRHASRMAHVIMSPEQEARRREELEALGLGIRRFVR